MPTTGGVLKRQHTSGVPTYNNFLGQSDKVKLGAGPGPTFSGLSNMAKGTSQTEGLDVLTRSFETGFQHALEAAVNPTLVNL